MISFSSKGDWHRTVRFLEKASHLQILAILEKYGQLGVSRLEAATPVRTGLTAASWFYEIEKTDGGYTIQWSNANVNKGVNIAIILQMGHGTRNGGYVAGRDYINPALAPIFDSLADDIFREVDNL